MSHVIYSRWKQFVGWSDPSKATIRAELAVLCYVALSLSVFSVIEFSSISARYLVPDHSFIRIH